MWLGKAGAVHPITWAVAAAGNEHGPRLREVVGPHVPQVHNQVYAAGRPWRGRRQVSIHPAAQVPATAAHALRQHMLQVSMDLPVEPCKVQERTTQVSVGSAQEAQVL